MFCAVGGSNLAPLLVMLSLARLGKASSKFGVGRHAREWFLVWRRRNVSKEFSDIYGRRVRDWTNLFKETVRALSPKWRDLAA